MPPTTDPDALVIHPAGALGDFVLSWPLLRSLAAAGLTVGVVAPASKAALAERFPGVRACPDHRPPWSGLWAGARAAPWTGVLRVIVLGERPRAWRDAAAGLVPHARLVIEPRTLDRRVALELARDHGPGPIHGPAAAATNGPIVLHAGAGGEPKRWPLGAWLALADALRGGGVELAAGEAELERWPRLDRAAFERAGGRFIHDLGPLADLLAQARAVVAADTGPGHLAAQLGVPTLSLFGPTDPARWAPIGACTAVLRAPNSRMADLTPDQVRNALDGLLDRPRDPTPP